MKEKIVKNCRNCNIEFEAKDKRCIFCSKVCYKQYQRKNYIHKPAFIKTCLRCKSIFETSYPQRIYCSGCIILRKEKYETVRKCVNCGKEFTTNTVAKTCSPECWESYHKAHRVHLENPKHKNVCLWCHGEFLTIYSYQRFCCAECGAEFRRMQKRIYQTFPFESDKKDKFLGELEKQGKDFQIKVRELIID